MNTRYFKRLNPNIFTDAMINMYDVIADFDITKVSDFLVFGHPDTWSFLLPAENVQFCYNYKLGLR
ncbi:hypothetical protein SDC9_200454 [bioreactor metagenome]|uniref:Uncharacterized protein n=1 Tax=bioreactor metagenome TaxID=1076179 RepID=A0A645IN98_9ZZZZ